MYDYDYDYDDGASDKTKLLRNDSVQDSVEMRERKNDDVRTSSSSVEETNFGGVINPKMGSKEEAYKRVKNIFPNVNTNKFFLDLNEHGKVIVKLDRKNSNTWNLFLKMRKKWN